MGTPEFAVPSLRKLVEAGHKIIAVFTQPDRPVGRKQVVTPPPIKVFAAEQGLAIHQPSKIKTDEARRQFEPLFKEADAGVVAAYGRILPEWMLNAPRHGCINVHSSLLPKYRGAALLMRVETTFRIFGYPGLAMIFFLMAAAAGLFLVFSILFYDEKRRRKH